MSLKLKSLNDSIMILLIVLVFVSCQKQTINSSQILWYDKPAEQWEQALPLGNGKIGVMVFGNPYKERIQLNDDSMWPGKGDWGHPEGTPADLQKVRNLLMKGKNLEADKLMVDKFSTKGVGRSHQTLGELFIEWDHDSISNYYRDLNLSNASASVSYLSGGQPFSERVFVSHPAKAIIIEFSSEAGLNGKITLNRPSDNDSITATTLTENGLLKMVGEVTQRGGYFQDKDCPLTSGVKFESCLKIKNEGGKVISGANYLELKNVKKATFYLVSNSSYYYNNFKAQNAKDLEAIKYKSYEALYQEHLDDYNSLFNRVSFNLDGDNYDTLPINKRIEQVEKGKIDLGLETLLFDYGRYLLIGCSRQGTNPANLQGLWNEHIWAPWNGDYHMNINLQMNYWLANVTNLDELNMPLFDFIDTMVENGKETAQRNFGCRGTFFPHATDLWATTFLRASTAYWGCSFGAGGWMMQHYYDHFLYTRDTLFLKHRAFPAIEQVAMFYSDWLVEDPRDGMLVSAPSTSPENQFVLPNGVQVASCMGSAMDQQIIAEVFDNYLDACEIIGTKTDLSKKIKEQRAKLRSGFILGSDGRILEWDREYNEPEPGHRHMSQLYGFHPGTAVTKSAYPELFNAVRKTLEYRLNNGGAGTGWSRAWLINCSARLLDGDMAHEHIQLLITKSMYENLFDAHPPFQIDGNFGYTAGVAEMLVQSHEPGLIRILPALPTAWHNGSVKGLKARGAITVDISWVDNKLTKVTLLSKTNRKISIDYNDELNPVELKAGEPYEYHVN